MGWVLLFVVCVIVLAIALKSRKGKKNNHNNIEADSIETDTQIMPLLEIDQSVIEPNKQLLDRFFGAFETIGMSSIAISEDLVGIYIQLADSLGRTHYSIENRNMISIKVNFSDEVLEFQSFPDFDSRMQIYYHKTINDGVRYEALIGTISGNPNEFLIQLGKVIKNTYPKIAFFVSSYDGTIDDGSNGLLCFGGRDFNLERR